MIFALLACSPGTVAFKGDSAGGADTSGVDSTDTGGDSEDTGDVPERLCGNMAGVVNVGGHWVYESLFAESDSQRERTVTSISDGQVILTDVQVTTGPNYVYTYSYTHDYRCDEAGMWLNGTQVVQESVSNGNTYTYAYDTAYNSPVQIAPAAVEFGSVWTSTYDGYNTYENGVETPFSYSELNTIVGQDPVELAIGEVTVFRVITEAGMTSTTSYYGEDVGLVKDSSWEITEYTP